jgi:hypothetical protein
VTLIRRPRRFAELLRQDAVQKIGRGAPNESSFPDRVQLSGPGPAFRTGSSFPDRVQLSGPGPAFRIGSSFPDRDLS